ncbi:MAG: YbaB/EbfC family nucleoid-associated protein [Clostridia bacterium]|nr:YbaB/EbfC family nucleoid-associated protein [Clostridia bacterium]
MGYKGGYGGFGGGNQMQNLMKQAQKMQQDMQKAQQELEEAELIGTSGSGMVTVTVNGKKSILGISIKPEAVDPDDVEMLEDLIIAAINDAYDKADELSKEKLGAFGNLGGML